MSCRKACLVEKREKREKDQPERHSWRRLMQAEKQKNQTPSEEWNQLKKNK